MARGSRPEGRATAAPDETPRSFTWRQRDVPEGPPAAPIRSSREGAPCRLATSTTPKGRRSDSSRTVPKDDGRYTNHPRSAAREPPKGLTCSGPMTRRRGPTRRSRPRLATRSHHTPKGECTDRRDRTPGGASRSANPPRRVDSWLRSHQQAGTTGLGPDRHRLHGAAETEVPPTCPKAVGPAQAPGARL